MQGTATTQCLSFPWDTHIAYPMRDRCSLIWSEVDDGVQVPGFPSPLRGSGDGEVFYSESGGGASWRSLGDEAENSRVDSEGQGLLEQCFEGD